MNLDDLAEKAEEFRSRNAAIRTEVRVCVAAACQASGSLPVLDALTKENQETSCKVKGVGCMGLCSAGPMVAIAEKEADIAHSVLYREVKPDDAAEVLASVDGPVIERLHCPTEQPFFARQQRIVRENSGLIDPDSFSGYVAAGGYQGLIKALSEMSRGDVLRELTTSGLRGRGGGGYPTGLKWSTVAKMPADQKYVICNGDEGDPGAFMDRAVLESDPHRVLEGMVIAGYAIGASKGYVYVRAEYPLAVERMTTAIRKAKRSGFLGANIAETQFSFEVEIRLGAGAFVCGEETALMASIEGLRGQPRPRPPYPAEAGLSGYPTLINNVETFANIAPIINTAATGSPASAPRSPRAPRSSRLAGSITNIGLIEVPMGMSCAGGRGDEAAVSPAARRSRRCSSSPWALRPADAWTSRSTTMV